VPEPSQIAELVKATLDLIDDGQPTPIILIDGRAGSGKSTLAEQLQNALFKAGESAPRVIHMDDLYPGWDGLAAGSEYLNRLILKLVKNRQTAEWQEFNWETNQRDGRWREFRGGTPLIVEGCGSLSRISAELADITIWLEVDESIRYQRWLQREGNDEYWSRWAAQEVDFYARERSSELASVILG
jgi:uridine kinase